MSRKLFLIVIVCSIVIGGMLPGIAVANSELKGEINRIQQARNAKQQEVGQTESQIKKIESQINQVENDLQRIDQETAETNQQIRDKNGEIEETRKRIKVLKEELLVLEKRIAERDDLLKDRVRLMYQNGGAISYLEVILGAQSFGDFLDRISALSTIAQQDRSILEAHIEDKRLVEEKKKLMEQELASLEKQLNDLEYLKLKLEEQRKQKDKLMADLKRQEGELHTELTEIENEAQILAAQEQAMKRELAAWQERERQRKAALQRGEKPAVTATGKFMRPTTGSISSKHGMRWGRMHYGIDIGKNGRSGDVPIVAAESGTVIKSYYSSSYGNAVLISHNVDGQAITTLYAHMENRLVSDGDSVSKGDTIGYMGNTGRSFGPHLHFEVHEGGWNASKSNAVDPLNYIPN